MFKKTFNIDLSRLFENDPIEISKNDLIKTDYIKYFKSQTKLSIFEQCFLILLWKIYEPFMTVKQLQQLERFVLDRMKTFYLFFCYNLHNFVKPPNKNTAIPRKKRQLPLTHKLTHLHSFFTVETEEVALHKFLINFVLSSTKD